MCKFQILKKRKDFLRAADGIHVATHHVIVQAAHSLLSSSDTLSRIGFTATKRLGKAHVRNRTKRRLRAVIREVYDKLANNGTDYVLIGRRDTYCCPFNELQRDIAYAFKKINKQLDEKPKNEEHTDFSD